jgi:hypothetical protein
MRFRQGGLIGHPEDYIDEKVDQRKRSYYWYGYNYKRYGHHHEI